MLGKLAAKLGVTRSQLVLAWLLHQRAPELVTLVGPRTLDQYEAAMAALSIRLDADQLARLAIAGEGADCRQQRLPSAT
ncbi:aldo/keto reductase [Plantactinospora sp. CA-290183]|uniref:aldo/keto reductase n=1 Tax=Plantactinospora sp. CA-290183 TaxID=3240006 RepID=UPI003D90BA97